MTDLNFTRQSLLASTLVIILLDYFIHNTVLYLCLKNACGGRVLCQTYYVHNSKTFVDELHLVRMYEDQSLKSSNFRKQKCSSKFHKIQEF